MKKTVLALFLILALTAQSSFAASPFQDFWSMAKGWFAFGSPAPTPMVEIPRPK